MPSTVLPVSLEFCRPLLPLPTWTFYCAVCQMLMVARLFQDAATIMPPFRFLVDVIKEAAPNMLVYVLSLAPISVLTALMQGELFGIFDEGYADPSIALTRVVRLLTVPPPTNVVETANYAATPRASHLLYYWSTFVLRLAFGSFIVAILVGAFNKVTAREAADKKAHAAFLALPPGYSDASEHQQTFATSVTNVVTFTLTSHAYGASGSALLAVLEGVRERAALLERTDAQHGDLASHDAAARAPAAAGAADPKHADSAAAHPTRGESKPPMIGHA